MGKLKTYYRILFPSKGKLKLVSDNNPDVINKCINIYRPKTAIKILEFAPDHASFIDLITNYTPLILACKAKYTELANKLIDTKLANINHVHNTASSAVKLVIKHKMISTLDKLILNSVNLDLDDILMLFQTLEKEKLTLIVNVPYIYEIIKQNAKYVLKYCVTTGYVFKQLVIDTPDIDPSLLTYAIEKMNLDYFELLLKHSNIEINHINKQGNTFLISACERYQKYMYEESTKPELPSNIETIIRLLLHPQMADKYNLACENDIGQSAFNILISCSKFRLDWYHPPDYDPRIPIRDTVIHLFKMLLKYPNNKHMLHAGLIIALGNKNTDLCSDFMFRYKFDPDYVVYGQSIYSHLTCYQAMDLLSRLSSQTRDQHVANIINNINK